MCLLRSLRAGPLGRLRLQGKICTDCRHCELDYDEGYSDVTPGAGLMVDCLKGVWEIRDPYGDLKFKLSDKLKMAEGCEHYEPERWAKDPGMDDEGQAQDPCA